MTLVIWNGHFHVSPLLFATNEWSQLLPARGLVCCAKCDLDAKYCLSICLYSTLDPKRPWRPLSLVWEGASGAVPRTAAWTRLLTLYVWGCSDHRLTLPHNGSWWEGTAPQALLQHWGIDEMILGLGRVWGQGTSNTFTLIVTIDAETSGC